jgi:hypothetical protein
MISITFSDCKTWLENSDIFKGRYNSSNLLMCPNYFKIEQPTKYHIDNEVMARIIMSSISKLCIKQGNIGVKQVLTIPTASRNLLKIMFRVYRDT